MTEEAGAFPKFVEDDRISLTVGGITMLATVVLASPNGRSLLLKLDTPSEGPLAGRINLMPVLHGDGAFRCVLSGAVVELRHLH